jgi:uncharacterized membrane protein
MVNGKWIKAIGLAASVVGTIATLIGDWSHKKQDEERIDQRCNEIFDERFAKIQEVEFEEIEEEQTA